jgi:hypothetical protein
MASNVDVSSSADKLPRPDRVAQAVVEDMRQLGQRGEPVPAEPVEMLQQASIAVVTSYIKPRL